MELSKAIASITLSGLLQMKLGYDCIRQTSTLWVHLTNNMKQQLRILCQVEKNTLI